MHLDNERVPLSPEAVCPLLNGMPIPEVVLQTADGNTFELAASIRREPAALVFYRGGW